MNIDDKYRNKSINLIINTQKEVNRYLKLSIDNLSKEVAKNKWHSKRNKKFVEYMKKWQSELNKNLQDTMQLSVNKSWGLAESKALEWGEYFTDSATLATEFMRPNKEALTAFVQRKIKGLSWSQKLWNISKNSNKLIEDYLATGILEGQSARDISKNITRMMKNPLSEKIPVIQPDGSVAIRTFKSQSDFLLSPPLYGQYKNPYKAALRMVRTEINASYLRSDHDQRQHQRFVVGVRVKLSAAHKDFDICDSLIGDYPKTFIFEGWHPNCLCYAVSIRMTKEEFKKGATTSKNTVSKIPKSTERLAKAIKEGKMGSPSMKEASWLKNNFDSNGNPLKKVGGTTGVKAYENKKDLSYDKKKTDYLQKSKV